MKIIFLVASLEVGCRGAIFKMNIFDYALAFLLSFMGMLLSFCFNLIQCWKKKNAEQTNTATEFPLANNHEAGFKINIIKKSK